MENWRKYNGTIIPKAPPHAFITESENEIKKLIKSQSAFFARWVSDFDISEKTDFWYIINDTPMVILDYTSKVRNEIRKGLKEFSVELITRDYLLNYGYEIYDAAFNGYITDLTPKTKDEFEKELLSARGEWEYWGVIKEGVMVAYCKTKIFEDCCEYSSIKLHPKFLRLHASAALIYTMNQSYLNDRGFKYINNGSRSLHHATNFSSFLIKKFKFRKAYCHLHIIYSPWVSTILKISYPFRFLLKYFNNKFVNKIKVLIKHEEIRRSFL